MLDEDGIAKQFAIGADLVGRTTRREDGLAGVAEHELVSELLYGALIVERRVESTE